MKTVTVKCDLCFNIMSNHDVMTGLKWQADFDRCEIFVYGTKSEFCSIICLRNFLKKGDSEPDATNPGEITIPPGSLDSVPHFGEITVT